MSVRICFPKTFLGHPHLWKLQTLLQSTLAGADHNHIIVKVTYFLCKQPLPIDKFPLIHGTYARTILHRSDNGLEAMAAQWSKATVLSVHGHPSFAFYFVAQGCLEIDNYIRCGDQVTKTTTEILTAEEYISLTGEIGTFDNNIHQVHAIEETLSIHTSSDDSAKGEVFSQVTQSF